jgi:hypothetical protein
MEEEMASLQDNRCSLTYTKIFIFNIAIRFEILYVLHVFNAFRTAVRISRKCLEYFVWLVAGRYELQVVRKEKRCSVRGVKRVYYNGVQAV